MASATLAELRAATYKRRDSWWTVLLVDPVAIHLVRAAIGRRWITPNRITLTAFALGFVTAGFFVLGTTPWLVAGALLYHVTFILDCVDGKLARWQGSGSVVGGWMDFTLDQVRLVLCAVALLGGQYLATDRGVFLLMAVIVVFLTMFRYFNGFLMERALLDLRGTPGRTATIGDEDGEIPAAGPPSTSASPSSPSSPPSSPLGGLRDWLTRRRIRMNVYSGIEFQMAVLVITPLAAALLPGDGPSSAVLGLTIAACGLMVAFELAQSARFLVAARRLMPAAPAAVPSGAPAPADAPHPVPDQRTAYSTTRSATPHHQPLDQ